MPLLVALDRLFESENDSRVVGSFVFSTLGIFRTCGETAIGIERPQNETDEPKEWPGIHVRHNQCRRKGSLTSMSIVVVGGVHKSFVDRRARAPERWRPARTFRCGVS
jgi:hypothetical protein